MSHVVTSSSLTADLGRWTAELQWTPAALGFQNSNATSQWRGPDLMAQLVSRWISLAAMKSVFELPQKYYGLGPDETGRTQMHSSHDTCPPLPAAPGQTPSCSAAAVQSCLGRFGSGSRGSCLSSESIIRLAYIFRRSKNMSSSTFCFP